MQGVGNYNAHHTVVAHVAEQGAKVGGSILVGVHISGKIKMVIMTMMTILTLMMMITITRLM